jgi:hypothetical protein
MGVVEPRWARDMMAVRQSRAQQTTRTKWRRRRRE